jgi:anti-sigma B factor antagonist
MAGFVAGDGWRRCYCCDPCRLAPYRACCRSAWARPAFTSQPGSGSGRLRLACCTGRSSGLPGAIRTLQFLIRHAYVASVLEDGNPVEWVGRQAIVRLPDHVDLSNAGPVGEELLAVINRGAAALIVDMTATSSCDYAGADALVRAYQGVVATGTQLRLVAPAQVVRRVLSLNGLDPLVSVYPSREAAIAACGVSEVCMSCELQRWASIGVRHHDHLCLSACSISSSSGSATA